MKTLQKNHSLVLLILVFLYLGLSSYARFGLPAFWDEPKIYLSQLYNLGDNALYYFTGAITVRDRPPGLHLLFFPWMAIFGNSLLLIRVLSFVYFCCGLVLFYFTVARQSTTVAMLSVAVFSITPIVQVYAVQYVGDPQLFFLFAAYAYLLTSHPQKWIALIAVGFLAGLTREPALALIPATLGFIYWRDKKIRVTSVLFALSPMYGLSIHIVRNLIRAGTPLNHVTVLEGHLDLLASFDLRTKNMLGVIFATYRLLPLVLLALGFLFFKWRKVNIVPLDVFAFFLVTSYFVVFSGVLFCLPRYVMPAIPFFIYLLLRCCAADLKKIPIALVAAFALGAPLLIGNPNKKNGNLFYHFTGHQDTLSYPNIVSIHQEVISKIKSSLAADATVQAGWPFMEMLRMDHLGHGPFKRLNVSWSPLQLPDAIIWTNFPEQIPRKQIEIALKQGIYKSQIWRFEDYVVELHLKVNAP